MTGKIYNFELEKLNREIEAMLDCDPVEDETPGGWTDLEIKACEITADKAHKD